MTWSKSMGLLFVPSLLALTGCGGGSKAAPGPPPAPTVQVTEVSLGAADIYTEYPAQTYARNMVEVRGRVEGYIEQWLFHPGQTVKAGDKLYVLDLRPFRAQVNQAEGNLKQSEADLDFARRQVSLRQAEANFAAAQATQLKAKQDYDRLKPLVEQDAASKQDLDAATAALTSAEAAVRASQATVDQTRITTETQIQSTAGKVAAQKAAVETAQLNLDYATITAPISGIIGDTLVPVGGLVQPTATQALTSIVPVDPIWVRFKVSEAQFLALKGNPASGGPSLDLILADNSHFAYKGKITNTLNQVDPRTGTMEVQAEFPNPQAQLLPGQFARVRYVAEHRTNVILIPQRAIQQNQNLQTVEVVGANDVVEARPVKTGPRVDEKWLVEDGLKPGDRVIVEGLMTARPGAPAKPVPYVDKVAPGRGAN